jgi:hypothetical protein
MITRSKLLLIGTTASLACLVGFADSASASTWAQRHPRRAEVNQRLANQNYRINRELREGEISRVQARSLHREDHFVRQEERFVAAQHHIEQRALNQQENGISRQIGN